MDNKSFYARQISLSEWFETFENFDKESFRAEDNEKRERLKILHDITGMPFDNPTQFKASDLTNETKEFKEFFSKHKSEFCALRLMPVDPSLPKLRLRGVTVAEVMKWYKDQKIDPKKYKADFIPHSENAVWSTIFVSNKNGIYGEIISGMHNQLTQGFYEGQKPILFSFDFKTLILSEENRQAAKHLNKIISHLKVSDNNKKRHLADKLKTTFYRNYLMGYFETISTKEYGLWFIDYNRILGEKYKDFKFDITSLNKQSKSGDDLLKGLVASRGKASGRVRIINNSIENLQINEGEILVAEMTTPDHVLFMKKASAIITDKGGVLSHAAIVAREFGIPCIVGTQSATTFLKEGDIVEVDAYSGIVKVLK